MRNASIILTLCGLLLFSAMSAFGQESLEDVQPGAVPSFCGIAVGEKAQESEARGPLPWTLKLIFADKETRAYLSDVEVTVTDEKGTQWSQTLCEGAWVVLALPKGTYKVTCIYGDKPQDRTLTLSPDKTLTEYFFW